MAVYQCQIYWLTHCYRGQAPSHIGFVVLAISYFRQSLLSA